VGSYISSPLEIGQGYQVSKKTVYELSARKFNMLFAVFNIGEKTFILRKITSKLHCEGKEKQL